MLVKLVKYTVWNEQVYYLDVTFSYFFSGFKF